MQINNAVVSAIFNTFDFPIRFMYSQLRCIRNLMYKKLYSSDFNALNDCFEFYLSIFNKFSIDLKDRTVLELGPGNSLIIAYNLLLHGAKNVILVDKYPLNAFKAIKEHSNEISTEQLQPKYFNKELSYMKKIHGEDVMNELLVNIKKSNLIQFIPEDLSEVKTINESVDIILSNSVFEHIYSPQKTIESSAKILKKEAYALHRIDLRDHYNFKRPFLFYKYSDEVWERSLTKLGVSYTNRLRYGEFKELFKEAGFEIIYENTQIENNTEKKMNKKFIGRNDLSISHVDFLIQNT
jgi:SAM-dependent methyltransferase